MLLWGYAPDDRGRRLVGYLARCTMGCAKLQRINSRGTANLGYLERRRGGFTGGPVHYLEAKLEA